MTLTIKTVARDGHYSHVDEYEVDRYETTSRQIVGFDAEGNVTLLLSDNMYKFTEIVSVKT